MFAALASGPLADDGPVPVSGTARGVLILAGQSAGLVPGPRGAAVGLLALACFATARVVPPDVVAARVAFPEESRTFARLLTGALRQSQTFSNRSTGAPE